MVDSNTDHCCTLNTAVEVSHSLDVRSRSDALDRSSLYLWSWPYSAKELFSAFIRVMLAAAAAVRLAFRAGLPRCIQP